MTTDPWLKHTEEICFHFLANWGIPKAMLGQSRDAGTQGDAGTAELGPC